MRCPACGEVLVVVEYDLVEVDYCANCGGVWLDAGELAVLFGFDVEQVGQLLAAGDCRPAAGEPLRKCPRCGKKMDKRVAGADPPITYARCVRGEGLWFDAGELEALARHGLSISGGDKVAAFLRGMFGKTTASDKES